MRLTERTEDVAETGELVAEDADRGVAGGCKNVVCTVSFGGEDVDGPLGAKDAGEESVLHGVPTEESNGELVDAAELVAGDNA